MVTIATMFAYRCRSANLLCLVLLAVGFTTLAAVPAGTQQKDLRIGPVPQWVKAVQPSGDSGPLMENAGTIYLLVDRQLNLERNAFYYHEVRKLTSENGVQKSGSISLSFDSNYEQLVVHSVQLIRNGIASNRLDPSRFALLPRERDPQRASYDSSYSAQLTLEDLRVGDTIEFAYTIEGANPLSRGKYSNDFSLQWDTPVVRNILRLSYPTSRNLAFKPANGATEPKLTNGNGVAELWYEAQNVHGRTIEDDVPFGYSALQRLEVTEFRSWDQLVRWGLPLFQIDAQESSDFQAEANKLRAISDEENKVLAALNFVQDEIRSVNLGAWLGSRSLTQPGEVLRRRFANDFDKALLLVALLRAVGIDAAPALVSDSCRAALKEQLPRPDLFDHTIVQVRLGEAVHWIDPWRDAQRGPLSQIYVGRFAYALVLRPETTELCEFNAPPDSLPSKKIVETYRIPLPDHAADREVVTEYHGLSADGIRTTFLENTREEIQKRYLQYYTRTFPEARSVKLPWFEEVPGQNACRVSEFYEIPHIWHLDEPNNRYTIPVQPGDINSALGSTVSPRRDDPLKLDYPLSVDQEIHFEMFEPWPMTVKSQEFKTEFFRVRDEPMVDRAHVQFNYTLKMLKDRVEVDELGKFNDTLEKTKDAISYTLSYSTPEQLKKARPASTFNWAVGAAVLCFLSAGLSAAYRYFRRSKLVHPFPPPLDVPASINGIGGWLVLLAIGQVLGPLSFLRTIYLLFTTTMSTSSWRSLTDPIEASYSPWWAPTLLFELFFNLGSVVFLALLIALFFNKRAAWPRSFIIFLIVGAAGAVIDTLLVHYISRVSIVSAIAGVAGALVGAAIWIPYAYRSQRVRATFRY